MPVYQLTLRRTHTTREHASVRIEADDLTAARGKAHRFIDQQRHNPTLLWHPVTPTENIEVTEVRELGHKEEKNP